MKNNLRITAGKYKGRKIHQPSDEITRPVSSMARMAIFNLLHSHVEDLFELTHFMDVCAGSGIMGLEWLSRGGGKSTFIEQNKEACGVIHRNIILCEEKDKSHMVAGNILKYKKINGDIIFVDPPYNEALLNKIIVHIMKYVMKESIMVIKADPIYEINAIDEDQYLCPAKSYGNCQIIIVRIKPSDQE